MDAAVFIVGRDDHPRSGALGVVLRSNPVHCALSLVMTLFGIAVLFIAQEAQFLAAVQVIVYAGAIVVLFLFVIMLLGVDSAEDLERRTAGGPAPRRRDRRCRHGRPAARRDLLGSAGGDRGQGVERRDRPERAEHRHARPVALHRLRLRVRGHVSAARDRGRGRSRARPARRPKDDGGARRDADLDLVPRPGSGALQHRRWSASWCAATRS